MKVWKGFKNADGISKNEMKYLWSEHHWWEHYQSIKIGKNESPENQIRMDYSTN
jgi:hypothetical protein